MNKFGVVIYKTECGLVCRFGDFLGVLLNAHLFDGFQEALPIETFTLEHLHTKPRVVQVRQQEVLHTDEVVCHFSLGILGSPNQPLQVPAQNLF